MVCVSGVVRGRLFRPGFQAFRRVRALCRSGVPLCAFRCVPRGWCGSSSALCLGLFAGSVGEQLVSLCIVGEVCSVRLSSARSRRPFRAVAASSSRGSASSPSVVPGSAARRPAVRALRAHVSAPRAYIPACCRNGHGSAGRAMPTACCTFVPPARGWS